MSNLFLIFLFFVIINSYIVNPKYVSKIKGYEVYVGETILMMSRNKKNYFKAFLADYFGN